MGGIVIVKYDDVLPTCVGREKPKVTFRPPWTRQQGMGLVIVQREEKDPNGSMAERRVKHPSNFEKISLVGQNIATRSEKAKQRDMLKYMTCDCAQLLFIHLVLTLYIFHQIWIARLRVSYIKLPLQI